MIFGETAAPSTGVGPSGGIKGVAGLAVVGEGIPEHEGIPVCQLVVELDGGLGLRAGGRKVIAVDAPGGQARKDAGGEDAIDRGSRSRGDEAVFERAIVFLLERRIVKGAVLDDRTTLGRACTIPVEVGRGMLCFKRIARVQR